MRQSTAQLDVTRSHFPSPISPSNIQSIVRKSGLYTQIELELPDVRRDAVYVTARAGLKNSIAVSLLAFCGDRDNHIDGFLFP